MVGALLKDPDLGFIASGMLGSQVRNLYPLLFHLARFSSVLQRTSGELLSRSDVVATWASTTSDVRLGE